MCKLHSISKRHRQSGGKDEAGWDAGGKPVLFLGGFHDGPIFLRVDARQKTQQPQSTKQKTKNTKHETSCKEQLTSHIWSTTKC